MVHILSEVVVVVGLTFYFNQKNKKLMAHIEDLAQRVEEQEDLLQKHDQIIQQLVDHIGKQQAMMQQLSQQGMGAAAESGGKASGEHMGAGMAEQMMQQMQQQGAQ